MKKILIVLLLLLIVLLGQANVDAGSGSRTEMVPIFTTNYRMSETLTNYPFFPVYREVDSEAPITSAIKTLLRIEFTESEKGFESEWSENKNVQLVGVNLQDKLLTIKLSDPHRFTSGGSYKATSLKKQLKMTVLQFSKVEKVQFEGPEDLFQP